MALTEYLDEDFEYDHDYPPGDWTVDGLAAAFEETVASYPIPSYEDEGVWTEIRSDPLTRPLVETVRARAATLHERGFDHPKATEYMARRGEDDRSYDLQDRVDELGTLALAECFERDGRYLDDILDWAWSICEATTWVGPYHLTHPRNEELNVERLPHVLSPEENQIDLRVAEYVQNLAEIDYVLGDRLHPALRERIRAEADRRVFRAYEERDDFWWATVSTNNWNAVCNNGVLTAAMYLLDDPDRLASIVAEGVSSLRHYLDCFGPDGGITEGVGYWGYGMRNYTEVATQLEGRTDGQYSLFSPPVIDEIVRFPERTELSLHRFPPFADNSEVNYFTPYVCCKLGERFGLDEFAARGRETLRRDETPLSHVRPFSAAVRNLTWCRAVDDGPIWTDRPEQSFFEGAEWWIDRDDPADPDGLVVAAKGGHNAEDHNHNDCGTFVVHYRGESLLTDLGGPSYFEGYFVDERYETLAARSLGHSVPYVNETEQASSVYPPREGEFDATVTNLASGADREVFEVELADCYPEEAEVDSLRRRFTLARGDPGTLEITDRASFDADAAREEFESLFVSYSPIEMSGDGFRVEGDRTAATVACEQAVDVTVDHLPKAVKGKDVWRARVVPAGDEENGDVSLRYTVSPVER